MKVNPSDPASKIPIRLEIASQQMADDPNDTLKEDAQDALARADALIAEYNDSQPKKRKTGSIREALRKSHEAGDNAWDHVADPEGFISEIRGIDDESQPDEAKENV